MNVQSMIKRLGGKLYTVTRPNSNGHWSTVDGTFVGGTTETLSILGSVQPLGGKDIISIPEGDRTKVRFRFYSFPELKNLDTVQLRKSDIVSVNGEDFQVESVENWPNHTKAIIVRVNTSAN